MDLRTINLTPRLASSPEHARALVKLDGAALIGGIGSLDEAVAFGERMLGETCIRVRPQFEATKEYHDRESAAFAALGAVTSRALVVGLVYTLLWEGVLAGLLEGTRFLSIRQATLGIAAALSGADVGVDPLAPPVAVAIVLVAIVGGFAVATLALRRFEIRGGD